MVPRGIGAQPAGGAAVATRRGALERLGRACARRHRAVALAWILAVALVVVAQSAAGGRLRDTFTIPGTDAQRAVDVLSQRFPAENLPTAQVVFHAPRGVLTSGGARAAVEQSVARIGHAPQVKSVSDPYASLGLLGIAKDGRTAVAAVTYSVQYNDLDKHAFADLEAAAAPARGVGIEVEYGGPVVDLLAQQSSVTDHSDEIGLGVALVIMLVAFGSLVAAGLPLVTALLGVTAATAVLKLLAVPFTIGTIAPILGTMIGLGVGIDYSLFVVTRFRQNLDAGLDASDAVGRAIATAGSAVLFAGITVCIAVLGLTFAGIPYVTTLGASAALFVVVMVLAALTLLPALLGFAGQRARSRRDRRAAAAGRTAAEGAVWARWAHAVARRPWVFLVVSLAVLLALAAPVLSLRLGFTDDGNDPTSFTQRRAYDLVADGFGPGANGPLLVTMSLPTGSPEDRGREVAVIERLLGAIEATPGVTAVTPPLPSPRDDAAVALVQAAGAPNSSQTQALVRRLRTDVIPRATGGTVLAGRVAIGGQTAELIDLTDRIDARLLVCIGAVVGAAFLLLMLVFRSIFVPLKAAVMNLLSIGAAYGVIVMVFQWGWGKSLLGLHDTVPIEAFVPLMMFAILFGLSMDYEVFLLSRIREEYLRTGDNREAVAAGLARTARVITSAALIMISVFLSFVASPQPAVKMIGLGLAVAVAVDASLVRLMLVPATMELLGAANWWLPRWLDRVLPHVDVDRPDPSGLPDSSGLPDPSGLSDSSDLPDSSGLPDPSGGPRSPTSVAKPAPEHPLRDNGRVGVGLAPTESRS